MAEKKKLEELELGTIGSPKTNTHKIKVGIREWNNELGVDIRRWNTFNGVDKPSMKGIRLRAHEVSEAITLLERAEQELKAKGIL